MSTCFGRWVIYYQTSLMAQIVRNIPAMQETWVLSLGREDSLQKKMATHSSTLAWRIQWTEKPGVLQSIGSQRSQTLLRRLIFFTIPLPGKPILCSFFTIFSPSSIVLKQKMFTITQMQMYIILLYFYSQSPNIKLLKILKISSNKYIYLYQVK